MKLKSRMLFHFTTVLILIIITYLPWPETKLYGDSPTDIENIISSEDNIKDKVYVIDMLDMDHYRIAAFKSGDEEQDCFGAAVFIKNSNNHYVFIDLFQEKQFGDRINQNFIRIGDKRYDLIVSNNKDLTIIKRVVKVNNYCFTNYKKVQREQAIILLDVLNFNQPKEVYYYFYDQSGKELRKFG